MAERVQLIAKARKMMLELDAGVVNDSPQDIAKIIKTLVKAIRIDRRKTKATPVRKFFAEGNRGGSYISLHLAEKEGMVHLEVGETCATTVDMQVSVAGLACILTAARDKGFQKVINEYTANFVGTPVIDAYKELYPAVREDNAKKDARNTRNNSRRSIRKRESGMRAI